MQISKHLQHITNQLHGSFSEGNKYDQGVGGDPEINNVNIQ